MGLERHDSQQITSNVSQVRRFFLQVGTCRAAARAATGGTHISAKHFSAVVKEETGQTAAYWIHTQVVAEAKMLLHMRRDLSVQAIADMLGFDEQATFSRYFKREVGMSPTAFRETESIETTQPA